MAEHGKNKRVIVLVVDDLFKTFQSLPRSITAREFSPLLVSDESEGLEILKKKCHRKFIIITGLTSSNMGGGGFFYQARQIVPEASVLIIGSLTSFLYQGGEFYKFSGTNLVHNFNATLLSIAQKMGIKQQHSKNNKIELVNKDRFCGIIGRSPGINTIYQMIENLKKSSATILIQGESGTGKELIAQTIHQTSSCKNRPFVTVNCGAIPVNLIESELFGHERGAFTSAINLRKGKFEIADKGTLFLDEIGELDSNIQVKLLRVLQEKEFQRVGGSRTYKTKARIIAATNKDLKTAMQDGQFRNDLFYRLNVVPLNVPPLRKRREDILPILEHYFEKTFRKMGHSMPIFSKDARKALLRYNYPGNVREMANIVERLSITCPDKEITLKDLPSEVRGEMKSAYSSLDLIKELPDGGVPLEEVEKELILKTLQKTSGNKQKAARILGITRRLLYLRLSHYNNAEHSA